MILRRIARPLLASAFIASGVDALRTPKPLAQTAAPVVDRGREVLPPDVAERIPSDPETLVRINAAAQIGGGVLLATGKLPRIASVVLAGSVIPSTVFGADFWNEADPVRKEQQRNAFIKNVGLLGGVLLAAADTEGKPSLAWRGRQKAQVVAAALPLGASAGSSAWDSLRDRAQEGAHVIGERSTDAAHVIGDRSSEVADWLEKHGPELADAARERSAEAADWISEHAPTLAEAARDRSADAAARLRDQLPELADTARERSAEAAGKVRDRAPELAEVARDRSAEAAARLRDRAPEFADSARDWAETARDKAQDQADAARSWAESARDKAQDQAHEGRRLWRKARS
ncbi:DoxX family protein [Gordonia soli]|uniref:DoxX family protein n=1 Tax=Gordonia soli NBRC 108243 TaxID=1223545 RepID=M0QRD1_9ACTN|nr:DoxX family protein [Gordonia soli]GAC71009.1 hypothetical protein GS4_46_00230 [Gordonia soli NBRC 108243]